MSETMELVETPAQQPQPIALQPQQPMTLVERAMSSGASLEQLRELMALQERYDANEARKAYTAAMAEFKRAAPVILKTKKVEFSGTSYMHATLGSVVEIISKALGEHGFSVRFTTEQPEDGRIVVTCTLTHKQGHFETDAFAGPPDTSGKKNATQGIASAISYGRRYTILGVTGLATMDQEDDDGRGAGGADGISPDALAEEARNGWIAAINECKSEMAVKNTWKSAMDELGPINRLDVHLAVKQAVTARLAQLKGVAS